MEDDNMEINGWKFNTSEKTVSMVDDKGVRHMATATRDDRVLITKQGTFRILRYPKFVINFVAEHFEKEVINKSK
jgi:hypothetical protein